MLLDMLCEGKVVPHRTLFSPRWPPAGLHQHCKVSATGHTGLIIEVCA